MYFVVVAARTTAALPAPFHSLSLFTDSDDRELSRIDGEARHAVCDGAIDRLIEVVAGIGRDVDVEVADQRDDDRVLFPRDRDPQIPAGSDHGGLYTPARLCPC